MSIEVVVLAAGQGSRMKSRLPKVLHRLAGKPLAQHVVDTAKLLDAERTHMVVGHGSEEVENHFMGDSSISFVMQEEQLGTGHAVAQVLPSLKADSKVLILYGDVPLTSKQTLESLLNIVSPKSIGLLTVEQEDPTGYGRIVRSHEGAVTSIVEHKDANAEQLKIKEVNTGILCIPSPLLQVWLPKLSNENSQGEYYLTDIIAMAVADGIEVNVAQPASVEETQGVNNRCQLSELERWHQKQIAEQLMVSGVTLIDPSRIDVRGHLSTGQDVVIDVNTVFEGQVSIGSNVRIGANCIIKDANIADNVKIEPYTHIEGAHIDEDCSVGPYARLRPGAQLNKQARIGNFVEIKKSTIGAGSKVNHLSYIGDAEIGKACNVGAGTITCNYDGVNKFKTVLGDGVFVGSNSVLVAPVTLDNHVFVAAASAITDDVPEQQLAIGRSRQINKSNWQAPFNSSSKKERT